MRGMLLPVLAGRGARTGAAVSAVAFSLLHARRLLEGAHPQATAVQLVDTFSSGFAYAAVRLRMGALWPARRS